LEPGTPGMGPRYRETMMMAPPTALPTCVAEEDLKRRTLTNLSNQRPTRLDLAHRKLDQAMFDAYGWPHDLTDEAILARLLPLNLERTVLSQGPGC
jgi:hypothetical protein